MPRRRVLAEGGGHQAGQRIEAFAEIDRRREDEDSNRIGEADHREPPELVRAPAIARTRRQAKCGLAMGIRRRTPLGKSASMGSPSAPGSGARSRRRTVTGRKAGGAGKAGHGLDGSMSRNRRFQAWNFDLATPSWAQN